VKSLGLAPEQAAAVQGAFGQSFLSGFHLALLVAACVLLFAAVVAYRWIPSGAAAHEAAVHPEMVAA
jgi:hypothetical protein